MTAAIDLEVAIETGETRYEAALVSQFRFWALRQNLTETLSYHTYICNYIYNSFDLIF